jgi:hypothetical protein
MKKLFIHFLSISIAVLFGNSLYSQGVVISPSATFAVCPGVPTAYFAQLDPIPQPSVNPTYSWEVINGTIQGGTFENGVCKVSGPAYSTIWVTWNNSNNTSSIKVTLSNCTNANYNGKFKYWEMPILSLEGITPSNISGLSSVPFNSTSETYSIAKLTFPKKGTGENEYQSVNSYKWLIPHGWTFSSGQVSDGVNPVSGLTKSITVSPNPTSSGEIKVWGHSDCGPGYDSNPSSLTVSRVFPTINVVVSTSSSYLQGDRTPSPYPPRIGLTHNTVGQNLQHGNFRVAVLPHL